MNLLELQRRMAEDVRRPLTSDYEMRKTTENGGSTDEIATSYIAPNGRLSSFERLEIYNRQYWFRLISVVSEDFPTLNTLLGPRQFEALILAYLAENPSTSWTLRDLGAKLPTFLERHPEFTGRRHRLAGDVARLEWAYVEAFDGRHLVPITDGGVSSVGPDSKLLLQPHLQLLELSYPVDTLVLSVKKGAPEIDIVSSAASQRKVRTRVKLPPMRRQRVYLAIHRFEDSVYYRRIARETFLLLNALRSGATVAEAVIEAFEETKLKVKEQAELLRESFAHASELGWLCPSVQNGENPSTLVM
ncbi:MAG TPA: DNA-binding domain-containing protein [Acidobacteriaceae bacterium]